MDKKQQFSIWYVLLAVIAVLSMQNYLRGNYDHVQQPIIGPRMYVGEAAGFQDALFGFGLRYALTSGHLAGRAVGSRNGFESERRLGEVWKLEVEARKFLDVDTNDPLLGGFKQDSFVTLRITRYL